MGTRPPRFFVIGLGCCSLALAMTADVRADTAQLRLDAEPGEKLTYRVEMQSETYMAGSARIANRSGDVEVVVLEDDPKGNTRFAFTFANFEVGLVNERYPAMPDRALNGVVVHMTFSPRGEQLDMAPQSNWNKSHSPTGEYRRPLVKYLLGAFFVYCPEAEVKPDDSWVRKRRLEEDGDAAALDCEMAYTFEGFEERGGRECVKLFVQGAAKLNQPIASWGSFAEAKTEGEMFVDIGSGLVRHCKLTTEFKDAIGSIGHRRSASTSHEMSRVTYLELKIRKEQ